MAAPKKKSIIRHIPGFRSGTTWKQSLAICGYTFIALVVIAAVSGGGSKGQSAAAPSAGAQAATSAAAVAQAAVPTTPPARPTATSVPKIGDKVTVGNWSYQVIEAHASKDPIGGDPPKGAYEIVRILLTNVGKQTYPINDTDFAITDSAGYKYSDDSFLSIALADELKGGIAHIGSQYPPNVPTTTVLVFDINPAARGLKLNLVQAKTAVDLGQ